MSLKRRDNFNKIYIPKTSDSLETETKPVERNADTPPNKVEGFDELDKDKPLFTMTQVNYNIDTRWQF